MSTSCSDSSALDLFQLAAPVFVFKVHFLLPLKFCQTRLGLTARSLFSFALTFLTRLEPVTSARDNRTSSTLNG